MRVSAASEDHRENKGDLAQEVCWMRMGRDRKRKSDGGREELDERGRREAKRESTYFTTERQKLLRP